MTPPTGWRSTTLGGLGEYLNGRGFRKAAVSYTHLDVYKRQPKTLIFAKNDAHAEEIVTTVRQVFGKGNDFAAKITYAARDPKGQLQAFRTSPSLRVAVTVDMLSLIHI